MIWVADFGPCDDARRAQIPPHIRNAYKIRWSGRGAAEAHLLWEQGVVGSIPAAPTKTFAVIVRGGG